MAAGDTAIFGVRFNIGDQTHYGWVNITEGVTDQSINSWGYETTANTGIRAGATSAVPEASTSLGLLALGAGGLLTRRRTSRKA